MTVSTRLLETPGAGTSMRQGTTRCSVRAVHPHSPLLRRQGKADTLQAWTHFRTAQPRHKSHTTPHYHTKATSTWASLKCVLDTTTASQPSRLHGAHNSAQSPLQRQKPVSGPRSLETRLHIYSLASSRRRAAYIAPLHKCPWCPRSALTHPLCSQVHHARPCHPHVGLLEGRVGNHNRQPPLLTEQLEEGLEPVVVRHQRKNALGGGR